MHKLFHTQLGIESEHEASRTILKNFGGSLHSPIFIGSGGEGFVYYCNGYIHKFLVNWDYPKRNIQKAYDNLCLLSERILSPKYLYKFSVRKEGRNCLHISYLAEPGQTFNYSTIEKDWKQWLHCELKNAMEEIFRTGFFITDPSPNNFVIADNCLRFIDYGTDCILIKEATIKLGEMHFTKKLKKQGIYLWKL
jgi:hypothetical protein